MAQNPDIQSLPTWSWGAKEKQQLDRKFKTSLLDFLRKIEHLQGDVKREQQEALLELAETLRGAGDALDQCAANCHALSATLRTFATGAEFLPGESMPSERLGSAVGKQVVLTRTTIDELKGKTLVLERLSENNAILRMGDDYWGTPVDRILVVDAEAGALSGTANEEGTSSPPAISVSPKAADLLKRLEVGQLKAPLMVWTDGQSDIVRLEFPPEGLREFVPVTALPSRLAVFVSQTCKAPSGQTLDFAEAAAGAPTDSHTFIFKLKKGELSNALQFLTMTGRRGVLELAFAGNGEKGVICLGNGTVLRVAYRDTQGVEALARMLAQSELTATFADGVSPDAPNLNMSTDQLLIEAAVRADEIAGGET